MLHGTVFELRATDFASLDAALEHMNAGLKNLGAPESECPWWYYNFQTPTGRVGDIRYYSIPGEGMSIGVIGVLRSNPNYGATTIPPVAEVFVHSESIEGVDKALATGRRLLRPILESAGIEYVVP